MTSRGTATALRPPHSPVDVLAAPTAGEWPSFWSHRTGRPVHERPLAAGIDQLQQLAGLTGHTVLVAHGGPAQRPRVVAALRGLPDDEPVLAEAAAAAEALGGTLRIVHGVPLSFGERSVGLDAALARGERLLAEARVRYGGETALVRMRPHEVVGPELDADLLVVGGPRARQPHRVGLVASTAVQHAPCPVLLVPRKASAGS